MYYIQQLACRKLLYLKQQTELVQNTESSQTELESIESHNKLNCLAGQYKHTSSQEPYFYYSKFCSGSTEEIKRQILTVQSDGLIYDDGINIARRCRTTKLSTADNKNNDTNTHINTNNITDTDNREITKENNSMYDKETDNVNNQSDNFNKNEDSDNYDDKHRNRAVYIDLKTKELVINEMSDSESELENENNNVTENEDAKDDECSEEAVYIWDCSKKTCGWGNNEYTEVAFTKLKDVLKTLKNLTKDNLSKTMDNFDNCNSDIVDFGKKGHPISCHTIKNEQTFENQNECESHLLVLAKLGIHFPDIRTLKRRIYDMHKYYRQAMQLHPAVSTTARNAYNTYIELVQTGKLTLNTISSDNRPTTNINHMMEKFKNGIEIFTKINQDLPIHPCMSCHTLRKRTRCFDLKQLRKTPNCQQDENNRHEIIIENNENEIEEETCDNEIQFENAQNASQWKRLLNDYKIEQDFSNIEKNLFFICAYCLGKFKKGLLPPICYLNYMEIEKSLEAISCLTEWELMCIRRTHAFRTITSAQSVSGRKIPANQKHRKAKGIAIHLPIPIEETLKYIVNTEDENIIQSNVIHLAVRSGIKKGKKIIWEDLVRIDKVYEALKVLKYDLKNPHYQKIKLPETLQLFRDQYKEKLEKAFNIYEFETENDIDEENDGDAYIENDSDEDMSSMLNKISKEDLQDYTQYSITQINSKRSIEAASSLYKFADIKGVPIKPYETNELDVNCFPDLWPSGIGGESYPKRNVKIAPSQYAYAKLMSKDHRFRQSQGYNFYLQNKKTLSEISSGIYTTINVRKSDMSYTAEEMLEKIDDGQLDKDLATIFSKVRGTAEYLNTAKQHLKAMQREYGPATWFLTLSPCEWHWPDFKDFLLSVNRNFDSKMSINEMSARDPIMTAVFIENRCNAVLELLKTENTHSNTKNKTSTHSNVDTNSNGDTNTTGTFVLGGEVDHYFVRREYQGRCVTHFHMLIWIKDAPIIGKDKDDEIKNFIQQVVSCELPARGSCIYDIVDSVQRHYCNNYCQRTRNLKNKGKVRSCRFGFERPQNVIFKLNPVIKSTVSRKTGGKTRLYELPRRAFEKDINDYNPIILYAWQSNMDLQFISENSQMLTEYLGKYATKTEKSNINTNFLQSTKTIHSNLRSLAVTGMSSREIGSIEAADSNLGHWLFKTDKNTTIKYVNTNEFPNRLLKNKHILVSNLKSTDIFLPSPVYDRYPNRPNDDEIINSVCLNDFFCQYDLSNKIKTKNDKELLNNQGFMRNRKKRAILSYYEQDKVTHSEQYYHQLLLLFKPWRHIIELKNNCTTYEKSFEYEITVNENERVRIEEVKLNQQYILRKQHKDKVNEELEEVEVEVTPDTYNFSTEEINTMLEDFQLENERNVKEDYRTLISKLNEDQNKIFYKIISVFHKRHEDIEIPIEVKSHIDNNSSKDEIFTFLSGVGGTGKSTVIQIIRTYMKQIFNQDCAVIAPTGFAAQNVGGMTIHKLLQIPVQHNTMPRYERLSDSAIALLRVTLKDVKFFILEEISMISNIMFLYIHHRLQEIFGNDTEKFGKRDMLLIGDLLQLYPVRGAPIFQKPNNTDIEQYRGSMMNTNLWDGIELVELTINMRQKEDPEYADLLSNVRLGRSTAKNDELLANCTFSYDINSTSISQNQQKIASFIINEEKNGIDYTTLLPTNAMCFQINTAVLKSIENEDTITIVAKDSLVLKGKYCNIDSSKVMKKIEELDEDDRNTAGLLNKLSLKIGCKVMLRRNIDLSKRLSNGSIGVLKRIKRNIKEISHLIIDFAGTIHEIERSSSEFFVYKDNNNIKVNRKQFPIVLAYAITIHKAQGLSLKHVITDIGSNVFGKGMIYVALSRVTSSKGLKILNFQPGKIKANREAILEYERLRKKPGMSSLDIRHRKRKFPETIYTQSTKKGKLTSTNDYSNLTFVGTFSNPSNVCYSNAICVALLSLPHIQNISFRGQLKSLADRFLIHEPYQSTQLLRDEITQHLAQRQGEINQKNYSDIYTSQCAFEFLGHLLELPIYLPIKLKFIVNTESRIKCNHCVTSTVNTVESPFIIIHPTKTSKTIDEMIAYSQEEKEVEGSSCDTCHRKKIEDNKITKTSEYLCVHIVNIIKNGEKTPFKINNIPRTRIQIRNSKYKFITMVQHQGTVASAHYVAYVKGKPWTIVSDSSFKEEQTWPYQGFITERSTAKSAWVLFYAQEQ